MRTLWGYKLVELPNGAFSVHSLAHQETFHPVIGPVAEAEALYVEQLRLHERLADHSGEFVVWDVGLGAAANVLTVLRATRDLPCPLRVVSFDFTLDALRFALRNSAKLPYLEGYQSVCTQLAAGPATTLSLPDGARKVQWELHLGNFPSVLQGSSIDRLSKPHAILFDAFSPAKNPEMWTLPLFTRLFKQLDPERACALPTYSRSTLLRVSLLLAGFFVGSGHATGEKEETTIAGNRPELISSPLDSRWLRRARKSTSAEPLHQPVYRQAPLSPATWEKLVRHPQFRGLSLEEDHDAPVAPA